MASPKLRIAEFDLDESLAAYVKKYVEYHNMLRHPDEPVYTRENIWDYDNLPHMRARADMFKALPGWWHSLEEIEMGMRVFNFARTMGFKNVVLSKAPARHINAYSEKVLWCHEHLGRDVDVQIISGSKGLCYGRFLYDDYPGAILEWLEHRPRGRVIMPHTHSNASFQHPQVLRWTGENWDEVAALIKECYERDDN